MAIDMTTVKAISYNNKDVVKIEDSNGNILWQVATPSSKFFMSRTVGSTQYEVDNNTISNKTWSGETNFNGNEIWTDGDKVYYTRSGVTYELNESTSTWSQSTITFPGTTNNSGNYIWTDGTNIFFNYDSSIQYVFDKTNKTWTSITWTRSGGNSGDYIRGNFVFKANNKLYACGSSDSNYLYELDTTNYTYTHIASNFPGPGWAMWTPDGNTYYYSNGAIQYEYDFTTYTKTIKTWTGFTTINGARIIKYNNEIIAQNSSSPYDFYKLDLATNTWTSYTFSGIQPTRTILDMSWDYHGRWSGGCNCVAVTHK